MTTDTLPDEQRAAVETFLADWLSEHRIPGAAVAIVDGDNHVYAEGFGARTLEDNVPATPDTLFGIGSCTKAFTAVAVMQLVERDALALDDPVADYLPHLSDVSGDPITIEELLTHTSGMPSDGSAGPLVTRSLGLGHAEVPLSSDADFRRHVQGSTDRRVTDREAFFYYNSGYTMLGLIVEHVTGTSFAAHVEEDVLAPLGMDRSTFDRDAFEAESDRMTPYVRQDGSSTESAFPFDRLVHSPGGLLGSVREVANVVRLFFGEGTVGGERILAPESVAAMTTPVGTFGTYFDDREVGYGYGLMIEEFLGDRLVGHGGSIGVSSAWFGYLEAAELGLAVACTTEPEAHPADAGMAVLALLQDETPEAVQPHYRLVTALEAATGEYEGYREIEGATVERVGGGLRFERENAAGLRRELLLTPLRVEADVLVCTTTVASGLERQVRFEFDGDGVDLFFERVRLEKRSPPSRC